MNVVIKLLLSLPFEGRVILFFGGLWLLWFLLGRVVLSILSCIPFLLKRIFRGLYLLVEWAVAVLHKTIGGGFYRIQNQLAAVGERVDRFFLRWYQAWRRPRKRYAGTVLIICILGLAFVILPARLQAEPGGWLGLGETVYLRMEDSLVSWLNETGYTSTEAGAPENAVQIPMLVTNVISTLQVRDIPSTTDAATLESLKNGSAVTWDGELTFGYAEGRQEAWAKVITNTGTEGWCRLAYLQPEQNLNTILTLGF